jgi:hypothetical protein
MAIGSALVFVHTRRLTTRCAYCAINHMRSHSVALSPSGYDALSTDQVDGTRATLAADKGRVPATPLAPLPIAVRLSCLTRAPSPSLADCPAVASFFGRVDATALAISMYLLLMSKPNEAAAKLDRP